MKLGKTLQCAALVAGALGVLGCGISPGDYVIYRVTPGETVYTPGCFHPETEAPANEGSDSTTVRGASTWIIYASINDAFYLDSGTNTLEGLETDTGYQFTGREVDVQYDLPDGTGSKRTSISRVGGRHQTASCWNGSFFMQEVMTASCHCRFLSIGASPMRRAMNR